MAKSGHHYRSTNGKFSQQDAQVIGLALESLGSTITPGEVVAAAKPKSSQLHRFFDWNDTTAAAKFRLQQARQVINHIEVVVLQPDGSEGTIKSWFSQLMTASDDDDDEAVSERRYVHISVVQKSPDSAQDAISSALIELQGWKRRYQKYREFFEPVLQAIENVSKRK